MVSWCSDGVGKVGGRGESVMVLATHEVIVLLVIMVMMMVFVGVVVIVMR